MSSTIEVSDGVFEQLKAETLRSILRDLGQPNLRKREDMIAFLRDLSSAGANDVEEEATSSPRTRTKSKAAQKSSPRTAQSSTVTALAMRSTRFSTANAEPETRATRATRILASSSSSRTTQKPTEKPTAPSTRSTRKAISAPVPTTPTRSGRKRKAEEKEDEDEDEDDNASGKPESTSSGSPKRARMNTRSGKTAGDVHVGESISTGPRRGRSSAAGSGVQASLSTKRELESRARKRETSSDEDDDVEMNDEDEEEESASVALRRGRSRGGGATERASARTKKPMQRKSHIAVSPPVLDDEDDREADAVEPKKARGRGRPRKSPKISPGGSGAQQEDTENVEAEASRPKRGRPPGKLSKTKAPPKSISPESPDTEDYEISDADADGDDDDENFMDVVETEKISRRPGRPRRHSSPAPVATPVAQNANGSAFTSIASSRPSRTVRPPKSPIPRTLTTPLPKAVKRTYSRKKKNAESSAKNRARSPAKPRSSAKPPLSLDATVESSNKVRARSNFVGVVLTPFSQMQLTEKGKGKAKDEDGAGTQRPLANEADEDADGEHDIDMEDFDESGDAPEKSDAPRSTATEEDIIAVNKDTDPAAKIGQETEGDNVAQEDPTSKDTEQVAQTGQEAEGSDVVPAGPAPDNEPGVEPETDAHTPAIDIPPQADLSGFVTGTQGLMDVDDETTAIVNGESVGSTQEPSQDPSQTESEPEPEPGHSIHISVDPQDQQASKASDDGDAAAVTDPDTVTSAVAVFASTDDANDDVPAATSVIVATTISTSTTHSGVDSSIDNALYESDMTSTHQDSPDHHESSTTHEPVNDVIPDRDEDQLDEMLHGEATSATFGGIRNGSEDANMIANTANGGPVVKEERKPVLLTASPSFPSCYHSSASRSPHLKNIKFEAESSLTIIETDPLSSLSRSPHTSSSSTQGVTIHPSADLASLASLRSLHSRPGADTGDGEAYEQTYEHDFEMEKRYNYGGSEGGLDFDMGNESMIGQDGADLDGVLYGPTPMPSGMSTQWHIGDGGEQS